MNETLLVCPPDCILNPQNPNRDSSRTCLAALAVGCSADSPEAKLAADVMGGGGKTEAEAVARIKNCTNNGGESPPIIRVNGLPSNESPFHITMEKTKLPETMVAALGDLYREFQGAFQLPEGHKENATDYRYCVGAETPMMAVQVDMAALSPEELEAIALMEKEEAKEFLRSKIYEIEGSIAGYGILDGLFPNESGGSNWGDNWRESLDAVREKHEKPVVLLAPTCEKYEGMLGFEFGYSPEEIAAGRRPTAEDIKRITGFDDFMGPDEYLSYLGATDLDADGLPIDHPLLYVRASNPVSKLRNPNAEVEQPLFDNPETRRIVRAFTLTPNIDDPRSPISQHVNDTKSYMPAMGLAVEIAPDTEAVRNWLAGFGNGAGSLALNKSSRYNSTVLSIRGFLEDRGIDPDGDFVLRGKPTNDAYGGYGHVSVKFAKGKPTSTGKLKNLLTQWGSYMLQPDIPSLEKKDPATGASSKAIFRLFLTCAPDGAINYMGGFVNMLPTTSREISNGSAERVHGNGAATFGEVAVYRT